MHGHLMELDWGFRMFQFSAINRRLASKHIKHRLRGLLSRIGLLLLRQPMFLQQAIDFISPPKVVVHLSGSGLTDRCKLN